MAVRQLHQEFDTTQLKDATLLHFEGVDGYDVYNTTPPFQWQEKTWIFGRVEKRDEWAASTTQLFEEVSPHHFRKVSNAMIYPLEDPFVAFIQDEIVLGGTMVYKVCGKVTEYHVNFYRGHDLLSLTYFTSGPRKMKDIRLIELANGKIGVFSRHRGTHINQQHQTLAVIGYGEIDSLDQLNPDFIEQARLLPNLFGEGEWGGCNQLHLLDDGRIGVIGHHSWLEDQPLPRSLSVYVAISFIFDPQRWTVDDVRLIAQRNAYPDAPFKKPHVADCVFPSGFVVDPRTGTTLLYSGLGDCYEGVAIISNPFEPRDE